MVSIALESHKELLVVIDGTHAGAAIERNVAGRVIGTDEEVVAVADVGCDGKVQQPLGAQYPVVSVAEEQAVVVVQDAGCVGLRREERTHIIRQLLHIQ